MEVGHGKHLESLPIDLGNVDKKMKVARYPEFPRSTNLKSKLIKCVIYRCYYNAVEKNAQEWLCVEQSRELFSNMRRGGASNACFHSRMSPSCRQAVNFWKCAFILVHLFQE